MVKKDLLIETIIRRLSLGDGVSPRLYLYEEIENLLDIAYQDAISSDSKGVEDIAIEKVLQRQGDPGAYFCTMDVAPIMGSKSILKTNGSDGEWYPTRAGVAASLIGGILKPNSDKVYVYVSSDKIKFDGTPTEEITMVYVPSVKDCDGDQFIAADGKVSMIYEMVVKMARMADRQTEPKAQEPDKQNSAQYER